MKVLLDIPVDASKRMAEAALEGLAQAATEEIAGGGFPRLYASRVRYARERPGHEEWLLPSQVVMAGVADCEDLAAYRVGELRATGADEDARIVLVQTGPRTLHAVVKRGTGEIEDPSRALGMMSSARPVQGSLLPRVVAGVERAHSWMEAGWRTPQGVIVSGSTLAECPRPRSIEGMEVGFVDTLLRAAGGAVNSILPGLLGQPNQQRAAASNPLAFLQQNPQAAQAAGTVAADVDGATAEDVLRIASSMARIVASEGKRVAARKARR